MTATPNRARSTIPFGKCLSELDRVNGYREAARESI